VSLVRRPTFKNYRAACKRLHEGRGVYVSKKTKVDRRENGAWVSIQVFIPSFVAHAEALGPVTDI